LPVVVHVLQQVLLEGSLSIFICGSCLRLIGYLLNKDLCLCLSIKMFDVRYGIFHHLEDVILRQIVKETICSHDHQVPFLQLDLVDIAFSRIVLADLMVFYSFDEFLPFLEIEVAFDFLHSLIDGHVSQLVGGIESMLLCLRLQ